MTGTSRAGLVTALLVAALSVSSRASIPQAARQVPPLPPLPATRLDERLAAKARQPFSLVFSEPQPVRDVLLLMARDTGLSVVIDPDVAGTFTGELSNVTLQEALDIVLPPLGLNYTLADTVLRISRRPTETRFYGIDHVATRRSSERTTRAATAGVTGGVTSADSTDFYEEMSRSVGSLLSAEGSFTVDRKAGLLRVTDYPDRLDRVAHYLELAELRVTRQVQLQAVFVEIAVKGPDRAGIDWRAVLQAAGDAVTSAPRHDATTAPVLSLGLTIRSLDGLLKALATQGAVTVLGTPRVAVMNNEPAIVRAEQASDGVVLTVTPQISADRVIQLNVAPGIGGAAGVRGADTLVRVREGETVLIDGLTLTRGPRDGEKAWGADRHRDKRSHTAAPPAPAGKTELVILLTPTIVNRIP